MPNANAERVEGAPRSECVWLLQREWFVRTEIVTRRGSVHTLWPSLESRSAFDKHLSGRANRRCHRVSWRGRCAWIAAGRDRRRCRVRERRGRRDRRCGSIARCRCRWRTQSAITRFVDGSTHVLNERANLLGVAGRPRRVLWWIVWRNHGWFPVERCVQLGHRSPSPSAHKAREFAQAHSFPWTCPQSRRSRHRVLLS